MLNPMPPVPLVPIFTYAFVSARLSDSTRICTCRISCGSVSSSTWRSTAASSTSPRRANASRSCALRRASWYANAVAELAQQVLDQQPAVLGVRHDRPALQLGDAGGEEHVAPFDLEGRAPPVGLERPRGRTHLRFEQGDEH